jgi:hypothetical protein
MSEPVFLVPVFDPRTLKCVTIAVAAPNECEAVYRVLRCSPSLRYTGGQVERVAEVNETQSVAFDPWADRHKPERLKENAR